MGVCWPACVKGMLDTTCDRGLNTISSNGPMCVAHAATLHTCQAQKASQQKQQRLLEEGGPIVRQLAGELVQFRGANMAEVAAFVRNMRQRLPANFTEPMLRQASTQHHVISQCSPAPAALDAELTDTFGCRVWLSSMLRGVAKAFGQRMVLSAANNVIVCITGGLASGAVGSYAGGGPGVARGR